MNDKEFVIKLYEDALEIQKKCGLPKREINNIMSWLFTVKSTQIASVVQSVLSEVNEKKGGLKLK